MTDISPHGIWVLARGEEVFLPYETFPWFKRGTVEAVLNVEEQSPGRYYWPDLDIDLSLDIMKHPEKYPLTFERS
ncbi:MAG: DUF2442 domain-containing protein [Polyangiaceae bacterium]|nr:DUF2442 domain-containing protein [Polyangiaceae bacterium]MCW5789401.1 DUF2442 domain-containing protein [Polyangiaceae bacterium]